MKVRKEYSIVFSFFVLSGFAGLMYQVLFSKALALVFGSSSTATYTVLATYMGGMAIGSWLGGYVSTFVRHPLRFYAYCELAIAGICLLTPMLFEWIREVYIYLAGDLSPSDDLLVLYRVLLGGGTLLIPTILMGMTLPILVKQLQSYSSSLGRSVGVLYTANTIGAAIGALATGYLILPAVGVESTTLLAVAVNALVALLALNYHKKISHSAVAITSDGLGASLSDRVREESRFVVVLALMALFFGGAVTLGLEVLYMHLLAVVAGNSVYAFSLMLFAFLIGLSCGGAFSYRLLTRGVDVLVTIVILEACLCAVVLLGLHLWGSIPEYFSGFAGYPLARTFAQREVVRGLVCLVIMIPPAFFIGALYPVCMEAVGRFYVKRKTYALGVAAALNTFGNILGVLFVGFYLLPEVGAFYTAIILCFIILAVFLFGLYSAFKSQVRIVSLAFVGLFLIACTLPSDFNYSALSNGANVYFQSQYYGNVIDHEESVDGGLTAVAESTAPSGEQVLTLLTNGKFQGDNGEGREMKAQAGFGLVPLLYSTSRDKALVIGYGTGMSSRVIYEAGFEHTDLVDLSKDIVHMADKYFANINRNVSSAEGVAMHYTDGRNFLMLSDDSYDLVSMEVSSIWFAGAASLYNREFYELVRDRLAEGGVLQQWLQLHRVSREDLFYVINTIRSVFPDVWLYEVGNQGIIVAGESGLSPRPEAANLLEATDALSDVLTLYESGVAEVLDGCILGPKDIDRMLDKFDARALVSNDDNLFLEYSTPKGNVRDYGSSIRENYQFLFGFRTSNKCE